MCPTCHHPACDRCLKEATADPESLTCHRCGSSAKPETWLEELHFLISDPPTTWSGTARCGHA